MTRRGTCTGWATLSRLALRRDRVLLTVWILAFAVMAAVSANATVGLYPTALSRIAAADTINRSAALVALYGRVYDPTSVGALSMIKLGGFGSVFVAMLVITIVIRHTRADEESGRAELIGATAIGRLAPLTAAFVVAGIASAAIAALTAMGLIVVGLPFDGSLAFGASWGGVGLAFAAIAAVCAQVSESSRTATSLAAATLGIVYVLRAIGDAAEQPSLQALRWLSPIGWAQQFRPYAGDRWWVLLITLAFTAVVGAAALRIAAGRDLGAGLIRPRPGPADARGRLRSTDGLAWRLQRASLATWTVSLVLLGALLGALASSIGDFLNNPSARQIIRRLGGPHVLSDAFVAAELGFAALIATAYGIQTVHRAATEERSGHAEALLAGSVSRWRWLRGHLGGALVGVVVLMLGVGSGAGVARAISTGHLGEIPRIVAAASSQLPAIWLVVALSASAIARSPRLTPVGWSLLAACVILGELGALLGLSHWIMDASPFAHIPRLPGGTLTVMPLVILTAAAGAIVAAATVAFRHRDVG